MRLVVAVLVSWVLLLAAMAAVVKVWEVLWV